MGVCNSSSCSSKLRAPKASAPKASAAKASAKSRNASRVDLGARLSKNAALSASASSIYRLIKFLPLSARLMLEVLDSVSRLQKLIQAYGGTVIRVPSRRFLSSSPLAEVLGARAMQRFVATYGGTEVYIPLCADFVRRIRNANIAREFARLQKNGASSRQALVQLCRNYALTESRVRAIVKEQTL